MAPDPDDERTVRAALLPLTLLALLVCACGEGDDVRRTSPDLAPEGAAAHAPEPDGCVADPGGGPVLYRVERGDSLVSISKRFYGDPAFWREIVRANPEVVGDGTHIRVGDVLVIPFDAR